MYSDTAFDAVEFLVDADNVAELPDIAATTVVADNKKTEQPVASIADLIYSFRTNSYYSYPNTGLSQMST